MKIYIVDAFTKKIFQGNQAGVALLEGKEEFPEEAFMKNLAAELKHSETAFVKQTGENVFSIRYFTPMAEVELCGHATISAFTVMRDTNYIGNGNYRADTLAGKLNITVEDDMIWMDMASPKHIYDFCREEQEELYSAYGLDLSSELQLTPSIVSTGLRDILLPVVNCESLNFAVMDSEKIILLSQKYQVVGVHMFCLSETEGITAFCRNFAPLYGIPEEAATGTSNGALTYYLRQNGIITDGPVNVFHQGQVMGRESCIYTTIEGDSIRVGGNGKISLECKFF